jgi:hypothetical protein
MYEMGAAGRSEKEILGSAAVLQPGVFLQNWNRHFDIACDFSQGVLYGWICRIVGQRLASRGIRMQSGDLIPVLQGVALSYATQMQPDLGV